MGKSILIYYASMQPRVRSKNLDIQRYSHYAGQMFEPSDQ